MLLRHDVVALARDDEVVFVSLPGPIAIFCSPFTRAPLLGAQGSVFRQRPLWIGLWLLVVSFTGSNLWAQAAATGSPPPPAASVDATALLDEYVALAVQRAPALAAQRDKYESAKELISPAGALPDPMVGIMYQSVGAPWAPMGPMSMVQGEFSQLFPGFGKRQARRDAAASEASLRKAMLHATEQSIAREVRTLFAQIYAADLEQRALEVARQSMQVLVSAVSGQLVSGRANQGTLARVELERNRLEEQAEDVRANREILAIRLNRLLARSEQSTIPVLDALPELPAIVSNGPAEPSNNTSELRVQRAMIEAATRRKLSAETETRPNFLVGVSGGATTSGEPVVTLRFAMELPLYRASKQDPTISSAQHEVEAAEHEYRDLELRVRAEVTELTARLRRDTTQIERYKTTILPSAELALASSRTSYFTGQSDFSSVIEAFRVWLDAKVGLARREADRLMSWAELRYLVEHQR
jgi:outer membrane protein TolC